MIALIAFLLLAIPTTIEAQSSQTVQRVHRVGYLSNAASLDAFQEAFRQKLRDLGYIEKRNIAFESRFASGNVELHGALARELVSLNLDCIVASGVGPTRAAKQSTATIPIVMADADDDPVRQGLVASLAQPGGNVTGVIVSLLI